MKLVGKTALVTGGSNGIGKAIAQKFVSEGAKVIVFEVKEPDYEIEFYQVDISNEGQIEKAFRHIERVDILVNNAGVYFQEPIEKTTGEQLDNLVDTNLKGTYLICKHALPLIKKNKGNVINISSGLGIVPEPESPAYCSTKAAIIMLTKCMAQKYAKEGIRINAILPGPIDTRLLRNAFSSPEEIKGYARINPMGRIGEPEEVANVAIFLASEDASYVTGGLYSVDGGESTSSVYSR